MNLNCGRKVVKAAFMKPAKSLRSEQNEADVSFSCWNGSIDLGFFGSIFLLLKVLAAPMN